MSVRLALYKARGTLFNALIRWWTGSQYSHCELVINGTCYSSSVRDGGVRGKVMALPADTWDVIDLPWADEYAAQQWFDQHACDKYGWVDLLLCQLFGMRRDGRGVFCSEACAAALGLPDATRHSPGSLGDLVRYINVNTVFVLRTQKRGAHADTGNYQRSHRYWRGARRLVVENRMGVAARAAEGRHRYGGKGQRD